MLDEKTCRVTWILAVLVVLSSVYMEAMPIVLNYQDQAKMNSKDLMKPTSEEISISKGWASNLFLPDASNLAFTFSYGGKPSSVLIENWHLDQFTEQLDEFRKRRSLVFSDSETGLELRCLLTEYTNYPALEWVVFFENKGNDVTPVISNV